MDTVNIAKYSTHNIVPANRPIQKADVDDFVKNNTQEKPAKRNKKNKETEDENCKQE